jgi:hypothetical protein
MSNVNTEELMFLEQEYMHTRKCLSDTFQMDLSVLEDAELLAIYKRISEAVANRNIRENSIIGSN